MAKITITIEASSVADYQDAIELLSGHSTFDEQPQVEVVYNEQTGIPEGKVVGEQKRTRRTKAQIESDARAAVEGKPTSGSATTAAEGSQGQKDSSPQQPAGQSQSGGQDIFGDQIKEIAAEAKAEAAATASNLTAADVKAALTRHVSFHGNAAKAKNVILKAFASIDGTPCAKISDVQEKDYAAVVEQLLEGVV